MEYSDLRKSKTSSIWVVASNLIIWTSKLRGLIISKQWNRVFSARLKGEGTHCALTYEETKRPSRSKAVFKEPHIHIYIHTYMCMYFKNFKAKHLKEKRFVPIKQRLWKPNDSLELFHHQCLTRMTSVLFTHFS